jgi:hypothetical protein
MKCRAEQGRSAAAKCLNAVKLFIEGSSILSWASPGSLAAKEAVVLTLPIATSQPTALAWATSSHQRQNGHSRPLGPSTDTAQLPSARANR